MPMGNLSQAGSRTAPAVAPAPMPSHPLAAPVAAAPIQPMRSSAAPVDALAREVMARDPIHWRTTDAVPIDAIRRDVSRGGAIIEAGESQLGLGERIAALLKVGTPAAMADAQQLAKAVRERGSIRTERAGAR